MNKQFKTILIVLFLGFSIPGCVSATRPVATVISKPCEGEIQATQPVVVREEFIGGINDPKNGRYATDPKAASTSAGILVIWRTGLDRQLPAPNAYVRLLDDNARPIRDVDLLFERSVTKNLNFISKSDGALLTFCSVDYDNTYITSAFLDPYGKFISEHRRFSGYQSLCENDPVTDTLWTGSHLFFVQSTRFGTPNGYSKDIVLNIADAYGRSLSERHLHVDGMLAPHFASGHGRILMVVPTRTDFNFQTDNSRGRTHLAVHRFSMKGTEFEDPVMIETPPFVDETGQSLDNTVEFGNSFLVPTNDGWLLLASTFLRSSTYFVAQLAQDGSLRSEPELIHTDQAIAFLDVIPYGGGAMALIDNGDGSLSEIVFLSFDGVIRQEWYPSPGEYIGQADLVVHKGRLFVTYISASQGNSVTTQVLIRELQCVP